MEARKEVIFVISLMQLKFLREKFSAVKWKKEGGPCKYFYDSCIKLNRFHYTGTPKH